jgi:hypothetical protein
MKWFEFLYTLYVFFWLQFPPDPKEKKREKGSKSKKAGIIPPDSPQVTPDNPPIASYISKGVPDNPPIASYISKGVPDNPPIAS